MNSEQMVAGIIGILIGIGIAYLFIWGKPYSELDAKYDNLSAQYNQLSSDYNNLSLDYNILQQNYDELKTECSEALKKYQECAGREGFFTWIDRFLSLRTLAGLVGLI